MQRGSGPVQAAHDSQHRDGGPVRALDDPVRLEAAAGLVRTALGRRRQDAAGAEADAGSLDAYVRSVVRAAGDLSSEDAGRLRALLYRGEQ